MKEIEAYLKKIREKLIDNSRGELFELCNKRKVFNSVLVYEVIFTMVREVCAELLVYSIGKGTTRSLKNKLWKVFESIEGCNESINLAYSYILDILELIELAFNEIEFYRNNIEVVILQRELDRIIDEL